MAKKAESDEWKDIFIPDADISNSKMFVLTLFTFQNLVRCGSSERSVEVAVQRASVAGDD